MTVFVDDMRADFTPTHVKNRKYVMSHLWADTEEELMAMVDLIGVDRKWVQRPPKVSWLHFDIVQSKKKLALAAGAVLTDKYGPIEFLAKQKGDTVKLETIAKCRALGFGA